MKLKSVAMLSLLALTLPILSCIVTSHNYYVDISCDEFADNPTSMQDDFKIEIGDKIHVKLCSNPSTGFKWNYEMTEANILNEEDYDFEESNGGVVGALGKEVWTFEAIAKGTAAINMEYSQTSQGGIKGERIYRITVVVD